MCLYLCFCRALVLVLVFSSLMFSRLLSSWLALSALSCLVLSCLIMSLPCLVLSCLVLVLSSSCLALCLSCLVVVLSWSCLVVVLPLPCRTRKYDKIKSSKTRQERVLRPDQKRNGPKSSPSSTRPGGFVVESEGFVVEVELMSCCAPQDKK